MMRGHACIIFGGTLPFNHVNQIKYRLKGKKHSVVLDYMILNGKGSSNIYGQHMGTRILFLTSLSL